MIPLGLVRLIERHSDELATELVAKLETSPRTADLRKANIGFAKTSEAVTYERMKAKVDEALKAHFRPEFLNRIDEVVVFHELSKVEVVEIVDLMIQRVSNQLELQGLSLVILPVRVSSAKHPARIGQGGAGMGPAPVGQSAA